MAKEKDLCPVCGAEIPRVLPSNFCYDAGGWNVKCESCGKTVWVPADETKPIEPPLIFLEGEFEFEPETITLTGLKFF